MNLTGLYVQKRIIIYWHIFHSSGFHHICNIKCRLDCRYSPRNIFNAKNFNPHNKPISLLNVPICTQGMQRTWWPEAGTIIVTGPYSYAIICLLCISCNDTTQELWTDIIHSTCHPPRWAMGSISKTKICELWAASVKLRYVSYRQHL